MADLLTIIMGDNRQNEIISIRDLLKLLDLVHIDSFIFATTSTNELITKPAHVQSSFAIPKNASSRYYSDFRQHEFLGRGGFGAVVKARNSIGYFLLT
jgi:hypothetical protein